MKFYAYAKVVGSKYLGEVEADNEEAAIEKAEQLDATHISLCHQCSGQCEDAAVDEIVVEPE